MVEVGARGLEIAGGMDAMKKLGLLDEQTSRRLEKASTLTVFQLSTAAVMNIPRAFVHQLRSPGTARRFSKEFQGPIVSRCPTCRYVSQTTRRPAQQPGDDPNFMSIVDNPPTLVRAGRKKHGPGLIILGTHTFSSPKSSSLLI
jgi:hypothetical protein